ARRIGPGGRQLVYNRFPFRGGRVVILIEKWPAGIEISSEYIVVDRPWWQRPVRLDPQERVHVASHHLKPPFDGRDGRDFRQRVAVTPRPDDRLPTFLPLGLRSGTQVRQPDRLNAGLRKGCERVRDIARGSEGVPARPKYPPCQRRVGQVANMLIEN